jgi:hypothetical protein
LTRLQATPQTAFAQWFYCCEKPLLGNCAMPPRPPKTHPRWDPIGWVSKRYSGPSQTALALEKLPFPSRRVSL